MRTDISSFSARKTKNILPVWDFPFHCFLSYARLLWLSGEVSFGFLFSVSARRLCRVYKDNLSSWFLHKNWLWRFTPRSLFEINREFTAHTLRPRHTVGLGDGSMPKIKDCPDKSQPIAKNISCLYSSFKTLLVPRTTGAKNNGERGAMFNYYSVQ